MFERKIFFGFLIDKDFEKRLEKVSPELFAFFIHPKSKYLEQTSYQGQQYLGRYVPSPCEISNLEQMQSHIYSLLQRLIPDYPYKDRTLWLFPVIMQKGDGVGRI